MAHAPLTEIATATRWLAPPLTVWRVDGDDDELVYIVMPLLGL
jgi:hypothetical protein